MIYENFLLQLNGYTLNINVLQNHLLVTYDHNTIYKWISRNFPKKHISVSRKGLECPTIPLESTAVCKRPSVFERFMEKLCISGWIEFQHVLASIRLNDQNSSVGFHKFRILLEQDQNKRGLKIICINL